MSIKKTTTTRIEGNKKITTTVEETVRTLTDDIREQIKTLRAGGATLRAVAAKLGISPSTVHRHAPSTVTQAVSDAVTAPLPAPDPIPAPTTPKKNHISLVIDRSTSMKDCFEEAMRQANILIEKIKAEALAQKQETTLSLYFFSNYVQCIFAHRPIADVQPLTGYYPDGWTALLDANCTAIEQHLRSGFAGDPDSSFLVMTLTDGEENRSRTYTQQHLVNLLQQTHQTGRWTHVYMVPRDGRARDRVIRLGVSAENVVEWDNTVKGSVEVFDKTSLGVSNYFASRSVGMKSTEKFYATADASKLSKAELQLLCQDVRDNFKRVEVTKEMSVSDFCVNVLGKPWVNGACFYQLSKHEKEVHAQKDVLIMKRGEKAVWAGDKARELVGLPPKGQKATVDVGNLGDYEVFIKSTSFNRVLVRGTYVLVDTAKLASGVSDPETWDRVAAQKAADEKKANQPTI
jgi:AcrR family transcriptional regulator